MSFRIDASDLLSIGDWLDEQFMYATNKLALDLDRGLKMATPVDTGRARQGWTVETARRPYEPAFVDNNVSYMIYLWNGQSGQAPSGTFDNVIMRVATFGGGDA